MRRAILPLWLTVLLTGCIHVKMDPIEVHATLDVNVKAEKAASDLLQDIYGDSKTVDVSNLPEK